jgi:hypothetical protein
MEYNSVRKYIQRVRTNGGDEADYMLDLNGQRYVKVGPANETIDEFLARYQAAATNTAIEAAQLPTPTQHAPRKEGYRGGSSPNPNYVLPEFDELSIFQ